MTHEYPPHDIYDSVTEARVHALGGFGFTQQQWEFLVTVMVHSGCFLERQYCAFTGTVRGQNSREFMARLVAREFVRSIASTKRFCTRSRSTSPATVVNATSCARS